MDGDSQSSQLRPLASQIHDTKELHANNKQSLIRVLNKICEHS